MNVSIVIVNYNGLRYTRRCIESLFRFHNPDSVEIIVIDNNSSDGSQIELPNLFPSIKFISLSENRGFGAANNAGAKIAKGDILFFVNNDTLFIDESLGKLSKILSSHNDYGIVGPKLLNEDRSFQLSFGKFPTLGNEHEAKRISNDFLLQSKEEVSSNDPIKKDWVTGAALMIKQELFEAVGGFDEQYFMYFEDIDLCRRANAKGYESLYISSIHLIHFGGRSYVSKDEHIVFEYRRSQLRYYDKHNSFVQRFIVRMYIIIKFLPKFIFRTEKTLAINILKLVFSTYKH